MKTKNVSKHIKKAKLCFTFDSIEAMNKFYAKANEIAANTVAEVKGESSITVKRYLEKSKVVIISRGVETNRLFL